MLKMISVAALLASGVLAGGLTQQAMAASTQKAVRERANEEWPTFDKAQLKTLVLGRRTYQKNPVTGKGELFFVAKKLTPAEKKAFNAFKADIENVQAGDLTPNLENKPGAVNVYNSKYGKIKIAVMPDIVGADIDYEDKAGNYTAHDEVGADNPYSQDTSSSDIDDDLDTIGGADK